jgi:hypothetical protein
MDIDRQLALQGELHVDDPSYVPPSYRAFLLRLLDDFPELRPVVEEQVALCDGEIYTTFILEMLSSAVMERQARILAGTGTRRDEAIVSGWLTLGEEAMSEPFVGEVFLETAGDDLLFDERGRTLHDRLGPALKASLDARHLLMQRGGDPAETAEMGESLDPALFHTEVEYPGPGVRLTHLPTGLAVESREGSTQVENRDIALDQMRALLREGPEQEPLF